MRLYRERRRRARWRWRGSRMGSDHGCDCTGSRDDVLPGGGEGAGQGQITDATEQRAETTYFLEVEREQDRVRSQMRLHREQRRRTLWRWRGSRMGSDHRCDCTGSGDVVLAGGGEGAGWGQITDATVQGAETTYCLEVEKEQDRVRSQMRPNREQRRRTSWRWRGSRIGSDHRCDCTGSRDDVLSGGGEGAGWGQITDATVQGAETSCSLEVEREQDGVRSRMRLYREQRRRTAWRWRRSRTGSDHRCDRTESRDDVLPGGGEGAG